MTVCVANLFGQSTPQISIPFEIYDNAGGQKTLYFGIDQTATDGIDIHLGESDLPPYPPTGAFDARWLFPENGFNGSLSSWLDYRNAPGFPYSGTIEHRFRYQCMSDATEMYFKWNLPNEITGLVQDLINGTFVNVPLQGNGTYQIMNFDVFNQLKLLVYYNNIVSDVIDNNLEEYDFKLEQNYPNPFNPSTKIRFVIPNEVRNHKDFSSQTPRNDNSFITLKVYDILGNEIATLVNEEKTSGEYEVEFNASLANRDLVSGIYFYKLVINEFIQTKKMIFLK
jgi:hypothetical protein